MTTEDRVRCFWKGNNKQKCGSNVGFSVILYLCIFLPVFFLIKGLVVAFYLIKDFLESQCNKGNVEMSLCSTLFFSSPFH